MKKLRVNELKALIRKYKIGKVGGRKSELIDRIANSIHWNDIKTNESIPERKKRVFSKKQIEAQEKFANKNRKKIKVFDIPDSDITMEDIRDELKSDIKLVRKERKMIPIKNVKVKPIIKCKRCDVLDELIMLLI